MARTDRNQATYRSVVRLMACALVPILLSGCLAQQADLTRVSINLDKKISRLDQREKEIESAVKQANELIARQKKEVDQLVSETRAKLRQEISELREEDLPKLRGMLDTNAHQITTLRARVDDVEHRIAGRLASIDKAQKEIEQSQNEQASALKADRDRFQEDLGRVNARLDTLDTMSSMTVSLAKTLEGRLAEHDKALGSADTQARALAEQMAQFSRALADFKQVLTGLGDKLVQEEKHANDLAASLAKRTDALAAKVESDAKATTAHLAEVNKSVSSVAKALETVSGTLQARVDARLAEHDKALGSADTQARALAEQMAQFSRALADFKQVLTGLGDKLVQEEKHANDLAASLAKRTDALAAKVESDAKATTAHLAEVNKSVSSVAKALETVSGTLQARVEQEDRRLDEMTAAIQALGAQLTTLNGTVAQLQDAREGSGSSRGTKPPTKSPGGGKREQRSVLPPASLQGEEPLHGPVSVARAADPKGDSVQERDQDRYERAMQRFKQGDLEGALQGFSEFLSQYPASSLAPYAQYWLGECYYGKKDFERAIEAFNRVQEAYPASEKVPAALLKKGFVYLALNDRARASSVLQQVVEAYPKSPEAMKARDQLTRQKQTR